MKTQMNFAKILTTLVLVSFSLSAQARIFSLDHYEQAKKAASLENKLLMLRFTAKWCLPCQFMEKNVFDDYSFSNFLQERSIQVIVDVEKYRGMNLKENFQVGSLPTIIFLSPKAIEVSRKNTTLGITDMRSWVESLVKQYNITVSSPNTIILNTVKKEEVEINKVITTNLNSEQSMVQESTSLNAEIESKHLKEHRIYFGAYYVQMGAFLNFENAMNRAEELDEMFSQNASISEDDSKIGDKLYKINLGPFDTEEEAILFTEVLKDRKIEALVKKAEQ